MAKKNNKYSGRKLKKPNMKQEGNFTQIPNAFILNPDIRNPELRLLQYIMTYSENRTITTKNCMKYLHKTMPVISSSFEKLIALGILKITDENIEVIIPEEMKKYKLGYPKGKENTTTEVKKTLPSESEKTLLSGKENFSAEVKKTLLSGKENLTTKVKKTYKKTLEDVDNENDTNPIILSNTRVLPVPAKSGSTEQSHSNNNTKGNTGIELGLECDSLQSQASPSVLAPSPHTPKVEVENVGKESSLPIGDNYSEILPIEEKNDLGFVLENINYFKLMYDNAKWNEIDISNFSNAYISHLIIEKEKNNENERISSKTYYFISKLIQHSSRLENDSNLWMEFQRQCKSEKRSDIISKYTHSSMRNQI